MLPLPLAALLKAAVQALQLHFVLLSRPMLGGVNSSFEIFVARATE